MGYEEKYQKALAELEASGIRKAHYLPIGHKIAKNFGSQSRPPHYNKFWQNAFSLGAWFATVWGGMMWFFVWSPSGMETDIAMVQAGFGGTLFGSIIALYYSISARKYGLTYWDNL